MQNEFAVLEWDKIKGMLSPLCRTEQGKKRAESLSPLEQKEWEKEQRFLSEMENCLSLQGKLPLDVSSDLTQEVRLAGKGKTLSAETLERVAHDVSTGEEVKRFLLALD